MKKVALAILLIFALFCDLPAKTYIWTGEKGITRISNRPPMEKKVKPTQPEQNNEEKSVETQITNAAIYYSKALEMLKYPVDEKSKQKIENIVKKGWDPNDEVLEDFIKNNKLCLDTIEKAKALTDCDFGYKKPYKYIIDKEFPPYELFHLHKLLLVNARYYEFQKKWNRATNFFSTDLTLTYHIAQDKSEIGVPLSLIMEKETYPVLKEYLQTTATEMESTKISEFLNTHKKRHFPAKALVDNLKKSFISDMQKIADGVVENGQKMESKYVKKKIDGFAKEFMKQANQLANEYYGYLATAVESNKNEDWQKALNAWESLRNSKQKLFFEDIEDLGSFIFNYVIGNTEGWNNVKSRIILITIMTAGPTESGLKNYAEVYSVAMDELYELLVIADEKMR